MKKYTVFSTLISIVLLVLTAGNVLAHGEEHVNLWQVESVDTMKYSRDVAREKLSDPSYDEDIEYQVASIASTGATHVAIGTPYDSEFVPFLTRWVNSARKHNLKVWFRGNFSGWEEWFDYGNISREDHIRLTERFILDNASLFEDGDIFSSCPECENGGPGDPRLTSDVDGYRNFLIDEYKTSKKAFQKINKKVSANYFSMNGDVASLIMNEETTRNLGGIVVVDHYVLTPEKMVSDIRALAKSSGGKIVLGEFGAPIPDIHGRMTQEMQSVWLDKTLLALAQEPSLIGLNYWTLMGGSTEIVTDNKEKRKAFETLSRYYDVGALAGSITNEINVPVGSGEVQYLEKPYYTNSEGEFLIPDLPIDVKIKIVSDGYVSQELTLTENNKSRLDFILAKENEGLIFKIIKFFKSLFR